MAQFFSPPPQHQQQSAYGNPASSSAANLQFYPSTYGSGGVSGHTTPAQGYGGGGGGGFGGMGTMGTTMGGVSGVGADRGGLRMGWLAAFSAAGYDDEPPLLEELGINFSHIKGKTLAVLNPVKAVDQNMMEDSDVAGPILFCLLFGTFLLLSGKVHFGYIYGVAVLGSLILHVLLNLMAPPTNAGLNYIRSASVLGYCLLPLVFTSFLGVAYPLDGPAGYVLSALAIVWSTLSASNMFVSVLRASDIRWLVAYPLALFYSVFGIMSIFGSKASTGVLGVSGGGGGGAGGAAGGVKL